MKVNELSKDLGISNKDLISYLKDECEFHVTSHNQNLTDEMISTATSKFTKPMSATSESNSDLNEHQDSNKVESEVVTKKDISSIIPETKVFKADDIIEVRSVTPWRLVTVGVDKNTVYHWGGYGDVDYVTYKDLQALRRKDIITKAKVIIEDADLCYQWRRELGDTYKYFLNVEYPEDFFEVSDTEFEKLLKEAPDTVKEVIKVTAMNMVRNENYPSVQKLTLIDEILGTCIKDFL